jgi:hypothetical protein
MNVSRWFGSKGLMLRQKLLKAPARLLLLTFMMSAGMTATVNASTPRISSMTSHGGRPAAVARARARQEIDYSLIEGVQRWGINE